MEHIDRAFQADIITEGEKSLIEEYNQRLTENNVPVIYNLRHLRQLLNIHKSAQNRLFGFEKYKSYRTFLYPKKVVV